MIMQLVRKYSNLVFTRQSQFTVGMVSEEADALRRLGFL